MTEKMSQKKKAILILAAVLFLAAAGVAVGVAIWQSGRPTFTAVVLQVSEGQDGYYGVYLFTALDQHAADLGHIGVSEKTRITGEDGARLTPAELQPGQLIKVTFSGLVMETYPPQYADVTKVQVLGPADEDLYAAAKARREEWDRQFEEALAG